MPALVQVAGVARHVRPGLVVLLILELLGAAWLLRATSLSFPPLPMIVATFAATILALGMNATRASQQRRATARAFAGCLAQAELIA